jgi:diguanylate cyclase
MGPIPDVTLTELVLPITGLVLGAVTLLAGHVSYPRVQNLKVYSAGYAIGLESLLLAAFLGFSYLFVDSLSYVPAGFDKLIYALGILGAYFYTAVPAFPTYRTTRILTLLLSVLIVALVTAARFFPATFHWLEALNVPRLVSLQTLFVLLSGVGVVAVNVVLRPHSFYLRGTFSGLALLATGSWVLPAAVRWIGFGPVSSDATALLYAGAAPLFFLTGMLFHLLARMEHRVNYDPLLQIYNRSYCNQILAEQSNVITRPPIAVVMIDIDHFKAVNDTYGHQAGDRILYNVAQTVQKLVAPEGFLCRYGGEELIAFFPGMTGRDVVPIAQRIRAKVESLETAYKRNRIGVTVSLGLSDRRIPRQSLEHVVRAADKALYIAKENGRNQLRFVRIKNG